MSIASRSLRVPRQTSAHCNLQSAGPQPAVAVEVFLHAGEVSLREEPLLLSRMKVAGAAHEAVQV